MYRSEAIVYDELVLKSMYMWHGHSLPLKLRTIPLKSKINKITSLHSWNW